MIFISPVKRSAIATAVLVGAVTLTACTHASDSVVGSSSAPASSQSSARGIEVDPESSALVPEQLKSRGVIKVATDATYPPNEFFAPDNTTLQGMDVDLGNALGEVLGVKFEFTNMGFDAILPSLGGREDIGISALNDTKERQQVVDMVDYYKVGASFMVQKGRNQDLTSLGALCGKRVAVGKGTTQFDDADAQSTKCAAEGKMAIDVQAYPDQNAANLAVSSGRADVGLADGPLIAYAITQSNGALESIGQAYNSALTGIAVPKTETYHGLAEALQKGLQKLAGTGAYDEILAKWNLQTGAIHEFTINGATS
jgi:polar amino acid transport system substrate-binding protein